jgi:hypothetical protein
MKTRPMLLRASVIVLALILLMIMSFSGCPTPEA